ncbi:MAG: hypothetical protein ABSG82_02660 [Sedimentisphaerales bacterium]|jgi:hypothetical protein
MADFNPNESQVPTQTVEKPTSVMVFGVLNIAIGCWQLARILPGSYNVLVSTCQNLGAIRASDVWALLLIAVGIGLLIWLLVLGIGLLMFRKWSRRGSVMYAWIQIVLAIITLGVLFVSLFIGWSSLPRDRLGDFIVGICKGLISSLVYPILLLLFMQTEKVKRAFAAVGG